MTPQWDQALLYLRIVHVAPLHDAVHAQFPELIQVPPFEQAGTQAAKFITNRERLNGCRRPVQCQLKQLRKGSSVSTV